MNLLEVKAKYIIFALIISVLGEIIEMQIIFPQNSFTGLLIFSIGISIIIIISNWYPNGKFRATKTQKDKSSLS